LDQTNKKVEENKTNYTSSVMESNLQISFDLIGFYAEIKRNAHFFPCNFCPSFFAIYFLVKKAALALKMVKNQLGK